MYSLINNTDKKSLEIFEKFKKTKISINDFKYLEKNTCSMPSLNIGETNKFSKQVIKSLFFNKNINTIITIQTCNFFYEYIHYFWIDNKGQIQSVKDLKKNWYYQLFHCDFDDLENKVYNLEDNNNIIERNKEKQTESNNNRLKHKFMCENKSPLHYVFTRIS